MESSATLHHIMNPPTVWFKNALECWSYHEKINFWQLRMIFTISTCRMEVLTRLTGTGSQLPEKCFSGAGFFQSIYSHYLSRHSSKYEICSGVRLPPAPLNFFFSGLLSVNQPLSISSHIFWSHAFGKGTGFVTETSHIEWKSRGHKEGTKTTHQPRHRDAPWRMLPVQNWLNRAALRRPFKRQVWMVDRALGTLRQVGIKFKVAFRRKINSLRNIAREDPQKLITTEVEKKKAFLRDG